MATAASGVDLKARRRRSGYGEEGSADADQDLVEFATPSVNPSLRCCPRGKKRATILEAH